jgi:SSS family solute:Na+ symporter
MAARHSSVIMIYALLLVNVAFYVSGAAALSSAFHMSLTVSAVIIAAVSSFYCAIGGQKSAAYVSLLHTTLKCLGIAVVLCVALSMTGGISPMMEKLPHYYFTWDGKIGITTIIAWTIASIGSIFSTQYIIQAVSSLKGPQEVTRACYTAGLLCLPVSFALGLIGVAAKFLFPDMNSLYALPIFMNHMPPLLAGLVLTSFVASILVGVSSVALAISALIVRDFYVPMLQPSQTAQLRMARLLSVPIGFLPLLFVFFAPQVLHLSFFTRALRLSISVVAIFAFYLPRFGTNRGATLGLIAATVTTTAWYVMGDPFGVDDIYVALATPAIVMLLDWVITGAPKADTDDAMEMEPR